MSETMDNSAWVIETARNSYWNGHGAAPEHFVEDIDKAIRFARQIDAEIVRVWALERYAFMLRTAEHVFDLELQR